MWILSPLLPGGETLYLLPSKEYVVGRKNCDVLLPNDQSISRVHAHLTTTDQSLTLKDASKYGTFVNGQRLAANAPVNLKSGDNVTFGVFDSKFSVELQRPVVCSSCLDNDGKASLSQALSVVGGKLVNSWTQDCTHLVMPSAKVTVKTICALLCCRPIVKPEFFSELSRAAQQKQAPPKTESFIPELDEPSLNKEDVNLRANPVRQRLFTGKTFIFLSAKQLKRLSAAVTFGGGSTQLLEEGSLPRDLLESPQTCVIDATATSSQTLSSFSATEWANSVKNIVQRKGLRVIPESEIGLAAIYASCERHCNPRVGPESEMVSEVNPRIPSASLSQNVVVNETVLLAASQNITAYAVNTEPSQSTALSEVTGLMAVEETPEKKQKQNLSQLRGSKPVAQKTDTQCIVTETITSSVDTVEGTASPRKKPESRQTGAGSRGIRPQPSFPQTNGGAKTFLQRQSPQKPQNSAQASPQKQSTLTSFFQPVNKKRPLEDELGAVVSQPKRPVLDSSLSFQAPNSSVTSKQTHSHSDRVPAATSQTPLGSPADLFLGRSEAQPDRVQEEPRGRKRKEMELGIKMEDLESIMSEDMDDFDEQPSYNQGRHSLTKKKQGLNTVEALPLSKKQRIHPEENGTNKRSQVGLEKDLFMNQKSGLHSVSIKTEPAAHPSEYRTSSSESSRPPKVPPAGTSTNIDAFEDDDASFVEDLELLDVDTSQPKEETKAPLKPVVVKQEVQESRIDEELPQKLVLVEFRSLTVAAPSTTKQQRTPDIGFVKNYKCFRKARIPGAGGSAHIIAGSDLLVHNRGTNSDLDEWLKDAAEEERQSRRDDTVGDDLFRYNPSKLTRRR